MSKRKRVLTHPPSLATHLLPMSNSNPTAPPPLGRGRPSRPPGPWVMQWFRDPSRRSVVTRPPKCEGRFPWKEEQPRAAGEGASRVEPPEDRLAIGVMQALAEHQGEGALRAWIS